MIYDSSFCVRAFRKDNCQPIEDGYILNEFYLAQMQEASEKLNIECNNKKLSYELWKLRNGETPFFVWSDAYDAYISAWTAYNDTKQKVDKFPLKALLYFDELGCIEIPIFLVFSRMEID